MKIFLLFFLKVCNFQLWLFYIKVTCRYIIKEKEGNCQIKSHYIQPAKQLSSFFLFDLRAKGYCCESL